MKIEVARAFDIAFPETLEKAILYLQNVEKSLKHVQFIGALQVQNLDIHANLLVDVPVLGAQALDFHSILETTANGANLIAQPRTGKAWAAVSGQGYATLESYGTNIHYELQIIVHLELPAANKWGGKAFEKMAQATAQKAIERMTQEFPQGIMLGLAILPPLNKIE